MRLGSLTNCISCRQRRLDDLPDSDVRIFTQPYALAHLGRAVMYAQRVTARVRRLENKSLPPGYGRPFLLCARDPTTSLFTVVGLPFEEDPRSTATRCVVLFGRNALAASPADSSGLMQDVC